MTKVKAISPNELVAQRKEEFPSVVIEVVNELLKKEWNGREARIMRDDIVNGVIGRSNYSRKEIFDEHLLDFEDVYRDQGWSVVYDGPAYCESYDPYFLFKKAVKKDNR